MNQNQTTNSNKFTPANKIKVKVGSGGLDESRLDRADKYINQTDIGFNKTALTYVEKIEDLIEVIHASKSEKMPEELANIFMEIKATGGMFQYQLLSKIAGIALHFLENTRAEINEDIFHVIQANTKALRAAIAVNIKGEGGAKGAALVQELQNASARYFEKHHKQKKSG